MCAHGIMALPGLCTVELSLPFVLDFGAGNICDNLIATLMVCMFAILFGLHPFVKIIRKRLSR